MSVEIPTIAPENILNGEVTKPNPIEHTVFERKHLTLTHPVEYLGATTRSEGAPYDFRINESLFAEYLKKEFGFASEDFDKLKVHVIGEHPPKRPHKLTKEQRDFLFDKTENPKDSRYDPKNTWGLIKEDDDGTQHIIIYAFNFWRDLNMEKQAILRFAGTKKRTEKSWKVLEKRTELLEKNKKHPTLGRRFTEFLANVVPDDVYQKNAAVRHKKGLKPDKIPLGRAIPIINRFVYSHRAKNALKDHIIVHETSHSFHYKVSWDKLVKKLTDKLMDLFLETTAESDEIRMAKKSEWFGMVDFRVNLPPKVPKSKIEAISDPPQAA